MVTFLILLIILIPACFLIYKTASKAWKRAELEEQEEYKRKQIEKELEESPVIQSELQSIKTMHRPKAEMNEQ